ncbi:hypothetical protein AMATHDRAFT_72612 [Amanita thiersii Skay4041]|uniref:Proteasome activator PA28 C-terminal domain-containing protein n=1 Tax=Amanita thiersii Skay4041 TaxID=703135 RepID=A0A2A9NV40_9AGAR|nr:hypothetical protein AMATHDRAFT_72612 [Amanita thiersii Skay4041]
MEKDLSNRIEHFRKSASKTGEDVVFTAFPQKLSELLETTSSKDSPFHILQAQSSTDPTVYAPSHSKADEPVSKKRRLNGTRESENDPTRSSSSVVNDTQYARLPAHVFANKHIPKLHDTVKRECEHFVSLLDKVKLWVTLTMPNGDNFGVQIQEEVLGELHRAQESAYNLRDAARQDYLARAKICSKLIKYPNVEDYALALREHDEKQLYLARQNLMDLRNMYAVLTDLIHKNISKIRTPKANNSVGLY